MNKIFSFLLFVIISNNVIATVKDNTLICDKDRRWYNFITKDEVEIFSINFDELNIISIKHSYELAENVIFIRRPVKEFHKEEITKPMGWIFRRNLDYVSLDFINGDWRRKFLWSCEITSSKGLEARLKDKLDKFVNANEKKH